MTDGSKLCSVEGCGRASSPKAARGMCGMHYSRWRKNGDPHIKTQITREVLFWRHVDRDGPLPLVRPDLGPCWEWTAARNKKGYAIFNYHGGNTGHRFAYIHFVGEIPSGLVLDHLCRNRGCVNPGHLEPVTNRENIMRGEGSAVINSKKTHCKRGHEFTPANTVMTHGGRNCLTCRRIAKRESQRRYERKRKVVT